MEDPLIEEPEDDAPKTPIAKYTVIAVCVLVTAVVCYVERAPLKTFCAAAWASLKGLGLLAVPIVMVLCWFTTAVSGPAVVFEINGGILFESICDPTLPKDELSQCAGKGTPVAIFTICCGVWLGCITAFELGRRILKPKVEAIIKENKTMSVINDIISEEGWKFAFLMRLNPIIPFEVFNYAVAMTNLSFADNAIAALGTMPIVAFEVYSAITAAQIAKQASAGGKDSGEAMKEAGIKFAICGVLMVIIMCYGKKKYDEKVNSDTDAPAMDTRKSYQDAKKAQSSLRRMVTGTIRSQ